MSETSGQELEKQRRYRSQVPTEHRASLDTRLNWLWHQRFGTVQTVYNGSPDVLDVTAATLILQAVMARDLKSIQQLFTRLEGAASVDQSILDQGDAVRI
jgi:hypothetical protein